MAELNTLYSGQKVETCILGQAPSNLKGGCHISCPYECIGRGRVCVVTHGLNLPRHGPETARINCGS